MGIVVAIDGPAGAGKSSTAREVARQLNFLYVDTGAMYRAVTLAVLRQAIELSDTDRITALAEQIEIAFEPMEDGLHTLLNGEDVSAAIRSAEVASAVSPVSAIPGVRTVLVEKQRGLGQRNNIVMEGRDIGTHVFPQARFKFFLRADIETRAQRRLQDYRRIGQEIPVSAIIEELKRRDQMDSTRAHSPLKQAEDAIVVDTTHLNFVEQVARIAGIVRQALEHKN